MINNTIIEPPVQVRLTDMITKAETVFSIPNELFTHTTTNGSPNWIRFSIPVDTISNSNLKDKIFKYTISYSNTMRNTGFTIQSKVMEPHPIVKEVQIQYFNILSDNFEIIKKIHYAT